MQMATSIETDKGEMIVKRVSVPIGLEELMEGLTKEVILKKPKDICEFASEYFANLLNLREKGSLKVGTSKRIQSVTKRISTDHAVKQLKLKSKSVDTGKSLSRQKTIRPESPTKKTLTTKKIVLTSKDDKIEKTNDKAKNFLDKRKARKNSKDEISNITRKPSSTSSDRKDKKTLRSSERSTSRSKDDNKRTPSSNRQDSKTSAKYNNKTRKEEEKNKNDLAKMATVGSSINSINTITEDQNVSSDISKTDSLVENSSNKDKDVEKNMILDDNKSTTSKDKSISGCCLKAEGASDIVSQNVQDSQIPSDVELIDTNQNKVEKKESINEVDLKKTADNNKEPDNVKSEDNNSTIENKISEDVTNKFENDVITDKSSETNLVVAKETELETAAESVSVEKKESTVSSEDTKKLESVDNDAQEFKDKNIDVQTSIPENVSDIVASEVSHKQSVDTENISDEKSTEKDLPENYKLDDDNLLNKEEIKNSNDKQQTTNKEIQKDSTSDENITELINNSKLNTEDEIKNKIQSDAVKSQELNKDTVDNKSKNETLEKSNISSETISPSLLDNKKTENILLTKSENDENISNEAVDIDLKLEKENTTLESNEDVKIAETALQETNKDFENDGNKIDDNNEKNVINKESMSSTIINDKADINVIDKKEDDKSITEKNHENDSNATIPATEPTVVDSVSKEEKEINDLNLINKADDNKETDKKSSLQAEDTVNKSDSKDITETTKPDLIDIKSTPSKEELNKNLNPQQIESDVINEGVLQQQKIQTNVETEIEKKDNKLDSSLQHDPENKENIDSNKKETNELLSTVSKFAAHETVKQILTKDKPLKNKNIRTKSVEHLKVKETDQNKDNKKTKRVKSVDFTKKELKRTKSKSRDSSIANDSQDEEALIKDKESETKRLRRKRSVSVDKAEEIKVANGSAQESFDSNKLREQVKEASELNKNTNFRSDYNPYKLKQEIKQASEESNWKSDTQIASIMGPLAAAIKIQSIWRGFVGRKEVKVLKEKNRILVKQKNVTEQSAENHSENNKNLANAETNQESKQVDETKLKNDSIVDKSNSNLNELDLNDNKTNDQQNQLIHTATSVSADAKNQESANKEETTNNQKTTFNESITDTEQEKAAALLINSSKTEKAQTQKHEDKDIAQQKEKTDDLSKSKESNEQQTIINVSQQITADNIQDSLEPKIEKDENNDETIDENKTKTDSKEKQVETQEAKQDIKVQEEDSVTTEKDKNVLSTDQKELSVQNKPGKELTEALITTNDLKQNSLNYSIFKESISETESKHSKDSKEKDQQKSPLKTTIINKDHNTELDEEISRKLISPLNSEKTVQSKESLKTDNSQQNLETTNKIENKLEETTPKSNQTTKNKSFDTAAAVLRIQAVWRGFKVRKELAHEKLFGDTVTKETKKKEDLELVKKLEKHKAVSKIQALWRGYKVRKNIKDVNIRLANLQKPAECDEMPTQRELSNDDILRAATKIQAGVRGYIVRKKKCNISSLNSINEEPTTPEEKLSEAQILSSLENLQEVPSTSPEITNMNVNENIAKISTEMLSSTNESVKNQTDNLNFVDNKLTEKGKDDYEISDNLQTGNKDVKNTTTIDAKDDYKKNENEVKFIGSELNSSTTNKLTNSDTSTIIDDSISNSVVNNKVDPVSSIAQAELGYEDAPTRPVTSNTSQECTNKQNTEVDSTKQEKTELEQNKQDDNWKTQNIKNLNETNEINQTKTELENKDCILTNQESTTSADSVVTVIYNEPENQSELETDDKDLLTTNEKLKNEKHLLDEKITSKEEPTDLQKTEMISNKKDSLSENKYYENDKDKSIDNKENIPNENVTTPESISISGNVSSFKNSDQLLETQNTNLIQKEIATVDTGESTSSDKTIEFENKDNDIKQIKEIPVKTSFEIKEEIEGDKKLEIFLNQANITESTQSTDNNLKSQNNIQTELYEAEPIKSIDQVGKDSNLSEAKSANTTNIIHDSTVAQSNRNETVENNQNKSSETHQRETDSIADSDSEKSNLSNENISASSENLSQRKVSKETSLVTDQESDNNKLNFNNLQKEIENSHKKLQEMVNSSSPESSLSSNISKNTANSSDSPTINSLLSDQSNNKLNASALETEISHSAKVLLTQNSEDMTEKEEDETKTDNSDSNFSEDNTDKHTDDKSSGNDEHLDLLQQSGKELLRIHIPLRELSEIKEEETETKSVTDSFDDLEEESKTEQNDRSDYKDSKDSTQKDEEKSSKNSQDNEIKLKEEREESSINYDEEGTDTNVKRDTSSDHKNITDSVQTENNLNNSKDKELSVNSESQELEVENETDKIATEKDSSEYVDKEVDKNFKNDVSFVTQDQTGSVQKDDLKNDKLVDKSDSHDIEKDNKTNNDKTEEESRRTVEKQVYKTLKNDAKVIDSQIEIEKQVRQKSAGATVNLIHSGEFHDTITVPIAVTPPSTASSKTDDNQDNNRQNSPQGLVHTGELHDNVLPVSVQLNEAPPAGAEILTSHVPKSINNDGQDRAQASNKDASTCETQPDNTKLPTASMESEKRNNATTIPKKSMEAEAATKIQAGFRGYQVRKQLKNKISSPGDISNQRRSARRKSSGKVSESGRIVTNKTKSSDIEEKSAVKIQAGVRGFLVRRRQKKQKQGKESS